MKNIKFSPKLLLSLFVIYCYSISNISSNKLKFNNDDFERAAICLVHFDNSTAQGIVLFKQKNYDSPTIITARFSGLKKNGKHGFHIHEFGDLSEGCHSAGAHYNPTNQTHGGPFDEERHVGDFGNIESDENGNATFELVNNRIKLFGKYSILGRSCMVHADEDDLGRGNFEDSKTTGHSGDRIGSGVVAHCDPKKTLM